MRERVMGDSVRAWDVVTYCAGAVRTDWFPMRLTRKAAKEFADELSARVSGGEHGRDCDFVAATTPRDLNGKSTVKARGCDAFRARAYAAAKVLAAELGHDWAGASPVKAGADTMTANEIDFTLIGARKHGKVVLVYVGSTYYRGVPGEVERVDDWDEMTSTVVLNIGARKVPLMDITRVVSA